MQDVTMVGIDLGENAFHLHGQDKRGKAVFLKKLTEIPGECLYSTVDEAFLKDGTSSGRDT